jgi:hypothetical protein
LRGVVVAKLVALRRFAAEDKIDPDVRRFAFAIEALVSGPCLVPMANKFRSFREFCIPCVGWMNLPSLLNRSTVPLEACLTR